MARYVSLFVFVRRSGVGYLLGLFLLFILLGALALSRKRAWLTVGTRRSFDESAEALDSVGDSTGAGEVEVRIGAKTTSMAVHDAEARTREENSRLPFTRMDLAFIDLRYVVTVTEQDDAGVKRTYDRALLQGINGYAKAGELTALMVSTHTQAHTMRTMELARRCVCIALLEVCLLAPCSSAVCVPSACSSL